MNRAMQTALTMKKAQAARAQQYADELAQKQRDKGELEAQIRDNIQDTVSGWLREIDEAAADGRSCKLLLLGPDNRPELPFILKYGIHALEELGYGVEKRSARRGYSDDTQPIDETDLFVTWPKPE